MEFKDLIDKIHKHYIKKLPFTLYCLPDTNKVVCYFLKNTSVRSAKRFLEKGVVFAPFDKEKATLCMTEANSDVFESSIPVEKVQFEEIPNPENSDEHLNYRILVDQAIKAIEERHASKIVVSRYKEVPLKTPDLRIIIHRLFNLFPEAFNYVWYHPETGLWCGATPEILITTRGIKFTTMALAGTKKVEKNRPPDWTKKEVTEQQYVTDAITSNLQKLTSVLTISKTYTHLAGSVAHLRTDISGVLKNDVATLDKIVAVLHPTPAVCGTPREYAANFIRKNEGYDREFYTGCVGPIDQNTSCSQLYVNLRCIKIEENTARFYVGGGITADSNAEDEWQETQNKMQTMLQVLKPFLN
jgi:isochorismate synthase